TAALDWENGRQVIELVRGVARDRGATVLVVTHDPRLLPYADRVIEMADGELLADATEATRPHHLDRTMIELTPVCAPRLKLREPAPTTCRP
ncbi:MAG TPA: ABC transporter ATP-binding protein, partial [Fimbriiglobus sp.]|nr:ABC transporter ATP-binding protein [Fimbriiglobus sp.]